MIMNMDLPAHVDSPAPSGFAHPSLHGWASFTSYASAAGYVIISQTELKDVNKTGIYSTETGLKQQ